MVQNQQKPATRPAEFIVVLWQLEKPRHKLIQLDKAAFMLYQGKDKRYWASGDSTRTFIAKISKIAEKQKFIGGGLKLLVCLYGAVWGYWVLVTIRPEPIRIFPVTDLPIFTFPHSPSFYLVFVAFLWFFILCFSEQTLSGSLSSDWTTSDILCSFYTWNATS